MTLDDDGFWIYRKLDLCGLYGTICYALMVVTKGDTYSTRQEMMQKSAFIWVA